jgi:hypothetical protein
MNNFPTCSECGRSWLDYDGDYSRCCQSAWAVPLSLLPKDCIAVNKEEIRRLVCWIIPAEDSQSKEKYNELRKLIGLCEL